MTVSKSKYPEAPTATPEQDAAFAKKLAGCVSELANNPELAEAAREERLKGYQDRQVPGHKPYPQPALNADGTLVNPNAGPDNLDEVASTQPIVTPKKKPKKK